ncbi:MAG: polysaccharide deacetylase family protein [Alphaproteobacteria bacterium]|nr:polysaccharide deacetylase family protein [Alphaproteobacteria bacterium]
MFDALKNGLYASLAHSGLDRALRPLLGGLGVIMTFHRVVPETPAARHGPSHSLAVTADEFRGIVAYLRKIGYEIVSLDEVRRRLLEGSGEDRFACLTFDDGYLDNYEIVYPICRELDVPITIYITIDLIEGRMVLWWYGLEAVVTQASTVQCPANGEIKTFAADTPARKISAYREADALIRLTDEADRRRKIEYLEQEYGVDFTAISQDQAMSWEMIEELAASGLVTIGAHTVTHRALRTLSDDEVRSEIAESRTILEKRLSQPIRHFAYPFGRASDASEREYAICRALDFDTATTTRPGVLKPHHRDSLHSLPRISAATGHSVRALRADLSGVPSAAKSAYLSIKGS